MSLDDAAIMDLMRDLELADVAGRYPRDLSVGQRQRIAFGAVAVVRPTLLMLDEPTRGLDWVMKEQLLRIWRRWVQTGCSILLITHDVELVAEIADTVLVLERGRIIANGKAHQVLPNFPAFAPQISRLVPGKSWLTVDDAIAGLRESA